MSSKDFLLFLPRGWRSCSELAEKASRVPRSILLPGGAGDFLVDSKVSTKWCLLNLLRHLREGPPEWLPENERPTAPAGARRRALGREFRRVWTARCLWIFWPRLARSTLPARTPSPFLAGTCSSSLIADRSLSTTKPSYHSTGISTTKSIHTPHVSPVDDIATMIPPRFPVKPPLRAFEFPCRLLSNK